MARAALVRVWSVTEALPGASRRSNAARKLLGKFWQAEPLEGLAKLFECRIGGYKSCFQCHCQRRSKAVRVAKLVLVFHLCRVKGLRSIRFDHRGHMLKYLDVMAGTRLAHMLEQNVMDFAQIDDGHR